MPYSFLALEARCWLLEVEFRSPARLRQCSAEPTLSRSFCKKLPSHAQHTIEHPAATHIELVMTSTIKTNLIKIFEYLTALKNLNAPPVRDVREAREFCRWETDLPEGFGCRKNGAGAKSTAWFEVQRQTILPPPAAPEPLREWLLEAGLDPQHPPTRRESIFASEQAESANFFSWLEDLSKPQAAENKPTQVSPASSALTFTLAEEESESRIAEELASLTAAPSANGRSEIAFESDPARVALWEEWRAQQWQAWAEAALAQQRTNALYEECFALYQRLQREGDQIELLLGDAVLAWQIEERAIFHPLLVARVELLFDPESHSFAFIPTEGSAALELEMLRGIPLAEAKPLSEVEARWRERGFDLHDAAALIAPLREFIFLLDEKAELLFSKKISGAQAQHAAHPQIFHAPVLFVRNRAGKQWQNDFAQILAAIRSEQPIPASLATLASAAPLAPSETEQQNWQALGERILFPLPANEEQKEIARRLAQHFGVSVQGPPGTGKSHTIVNLIAHLLAHGKRVLITSQTERALRVLGEMINQRLPELAPLCVAVLESETQTRAELERALTRVYETLASFDHLHAERKRQETEAELQACREEIARLRAELLEVAEAEHEHVAIQGREFNGMQVAAWLKEREQEHGWLPDEISPEREPPLCESELLRLQELLATFSQTTLERLNQTLPRLEDLPTAAELAQQYSRMLAFEAGAERRENLLRGWTLPEAPPADLEQNLALVEKALRKLESFSADWLRGILQDAAYGGQREEHWQNFARECRVQLRSIRAAEKALAHYALTLPLALDVRAARADLTLLYEELSKHQGVSLRFRYGGNKRALRVFEEYRLNGNAPHTAEDMLVLLRALDVEESKRKFWALWANAMREAGGPIPEADDEQLLKLVEDQLRLLEAVLGWNNTYLRALVAASDQIKPYGPSAWHDVEWLKNYRDRLLAYAEISASGKLYEFSAHWAAYLREEMAQANAHALWPRLLEALEGRDAQAWESALQELQELLALVPQVRELQQLREKLAAVAPRWLIEIEAQARSNLALPTHWQEAWEWRRIRSWYEQQRARAAIADGHERLRAALAREARLLEECIAQSTWLQQAQRSTAEQKAALYSWLKTVQNFGKSSDRKSGEAYRKEATQLLQKCRGAIPVWIMPLERVLETFSPEQEKFDVIIVDESSQCPLFALSALFRGERAVIIGDHKQVSPEAASDDEARVHELITRHLSGLPNANTALWDSHASLFDLAQIAFASAQHSLTLREHFRCAPEIIRFSNERFYDDKIESLRLPLPSERLEPATVAVHVAEGEWSEDGAQAVNPREAEALVAKIVALCADERYARRTMGVISLHGTAQAELIASLLRARLSEEEMMRRRLLCGDAKHFQGDERDVMLLSLVASAHPSPRALTHKFDEQRFNVAASRGRDQVWLFHSLLLEDLPPHCLRHRLLAHYLNPTLAEQAQRTPLETFEHYGTHAFVRELYEELRQQGYRVTPEVKIGGHPFRIDLVVEGRRSRLGIICEGKAWRNRAHWEEEFERQLVLERIGWKFLRVRGSDFYHDATHALAPLWKKLAELEIKPTLLPEGLAEIFTD